MKSSSPSTPDTRSSSARAAGRVLGLAGVMLIGVLLALIAWLARESTLHAAADTLVKRSDGQLVLDGVSGTLLRPIHVDHAVLRSGRYEFALDDATLRWSPLWLFAGVVAFEPVNVSRVRVVRSNDEPAQLPQSLASPVKVRLRHVAIGKLALAEGDSEREIGPLTMDVHAGSRLLTIAVEPAETPWGRVALHADVANEPPFALHGKVDWRREGEHPIVGRVEASGELARIDLRSSIRAQSSAIEANAIVRPFTEHVVERAQARLQAVDPRHLAEGAPAALLDGTLDVAAEGLVLRGKVAITNNLAGTLDDERVPLTTIAATAELQSDAWALSDIRIGLGPAGDLAGDGRWKGDQVALALHGDGVNLQAVHRALAPTKVAVTMNATGDLSRQRIGVTLAQSNRRLQIEGTIDQDAVAIERARLTAGDASAEASGTVGLGADHTFDVRADLRRFDPSRFGNFRAASLNGRLNANGSLRPAVRIRADGDLAPSTLFGLPASGSARWRSIGVDDPRIAIDTHGKIGGTNFAVRGHLVDPQDLRSLDLTLSLDGHDMQEIYTIMRLPFPPTPPYRISGRLRYGDRVWTLAKFSGAVGRSDLAGDFSVDLRPKRPFMRGDLTSERLDMRDLGGFVGAEHGTGAPPGQVLPRNEYQLDKFTAADADIHYTGRRIRNESLPLNRMDTRLVLRNGVFKLDPLAFRAAGGDIDGTITLDVNQSTLEGTADLTGRGLKVNRLAPGVQAVVQSAGTIEGRVRLSMRGKSVAALLGNANGEVVAMMKDGAVSDLMLRLANLDIANTLIVMARGDKNIPIRCLVADFKAEGGVLVPRTFVLDTEHTTLTAQGRIGLRDEQLDLRLVADPKDGSVFALRGPIQVTGTFASPSMKPELGNAIARTGAAIALGILAPPAALLPFFELGKGETFNCSPPIDNASRFIARAEPATR
ncbi:MAG TPA: AsmA family protein [Casimicrobiaceae bacterium]